MKALLLVLLLMAPPPEGGSRAEAERLFALGGALHAESDAHGAVAAYEAALATGWTSAPLHLDLADAYLAAGDVGRARLHAERAAWLAPRAARPLAEAVAEAAGDAPPPATAVGAAVGWARVWIGATALTALALGGWLALMALAGWRLWTRRPSALLRRTAVVLAPVVVALGVLAVLAGEEEARPRGVVLAAEAVVRAGPSADAGAVATLPAGRLVELGRGEGLWRAVRLPDGTPGWAEATALEEV